MGLATTKEITTKYESFNVWIPFFLVSLEIVWVSSENRGSKGFVVFLCYLQLHSGFTTCHRMKHVAASFVNSFVLFPLAFCVFLQP